jgi:hypothetical protein
MANKMCFTGSLCLELHFRRVLCLVFKKNTNFFFRILKIKKIWKILAEYYLGKGGNYALRLILVKMYFFSCSFSNKITEDRLLSILHLKKLRNINVQVKCKKTRVPSGHLHVL